MAEKEVSPVLSEDDLRSTKKVRICPGDEQSGELEIVPEGSDALMVEKDPTVAISYRNMLLSGDGGGKVDRRQLDGELSEADYKIAKEGDIPCIEFSSAIRSELAKGMERSLIIKLLGRTITYHELIARSQALWKPRGSYQVVDMEGGFYCATFALEEDYMKVLTGGPWMVYGAYLTVQPWSLDFDAKTSVVSKMVAWIRIPGLSFRYYHKSTLRAIGTLLGEVVKIDYMTETRGRGKYARVTILIDLLRPLIPWIKVDGKTYGIEYEGLPHICFACGKYGHTEKKCPDIVSSTNQVRPQDQGVTEGAGTTTATPSIPIRPPSVTDHTPEEASSPFESWMQIAQTGALTNSDCDTRTDEKSPINQGAKVGKKLNEGVGSNMKQGNYIAKHGPVKTVQEYRPKRILTEHVENSKNKHNHGPAVSLPTSVVTNNGGMDRCSNPSPIDVPVTELEAIEGVIPTVPPVDPVPHVIQVPLSLDQEMHTVMFLQQSRAALEESNQCSLTDDMGSVARGKENRKPLELQKKQVGHGIKLHSTIRRNLKVKQKTQGTTISKDAIEILREELEGQADLSAVQGCSTLQIGEVKDRDDDPSGQGMLA
ncbi:hypothetical protein K1719_013600 [Acacia pycnantha]|nr:hypothetical protein K1719_013600 [Acacia pycnantha]